MENETFDFVFPRVFPNFYKNLFISSKRKKIEAEKYLMKILIKILELPLGKISWLFTHCTRILSSILRLTIKFACQKQKKLKNQLKNVQFFLIPSFLTKNKQILINTKKTCETEKKIWKFALSYQNFPLTHLHSFRVNCELKILKSCEKF